MRHVPQRLLFLAIGGILSLATTAGATTVASESKKGVAEAYATVVTNSTTVLDFGGKRATGASTSSCGVGCALVTFTGNFPTDITLNNVVLNSTTNNQGSFATVAIPDAASPTLIAVAVLNFVTTTGAAADAFVSVTVFVGHQ